MSTDTVPLYEALGLTREEYERIEGTLGREPTHGELAMFSVMWSEHCSYKSSGIHLRRLPSEAPWLIVGPGENAGVVEVAPTGGGPDGTEPVLVAFKIESHNHPSAVEPFQGAATGVGGIVRDILALGARPIALMDPLRFGSLDDDRSRYLFDGVVRGIAAYGNSLGLPVVGGEAVFDPSYAGNPLVNVLCAGIVEDREVLLSKATSPGQIGLLVGSSTGRDGIGGASVLASAELADEGDEKRPAVQVGDPFTEKLLIEACLELKREGLLAGLQDLGAAGITCALAETAAGGGLGVTGDLDEVHLREAGMETWEILMSESQERMLAILPPERVERAVEVCRKWGLDAVPLARYTDGGRLVVRRSDEVAADCPTDVLADGPLYERPTMPADRTRLHALDPLELRWPDDLGELLLRVLASPSIASKRWVWRQYDHMVRLNALVSCGADAAVLRVPETPRGPRQPGIALSTDGPGRIAALDPWTGGALAVCESARNVACVGARPLAITNCLNFGSPERPEVMWDFAEVVRGMGDACRAFGVPVTGGNVSFYNGSSRGAVHPTPVVGMLGGLVDVHAHRPSAARPGEAVVLLGETRPELGGSEALSLVHGEVAGSPPAVDPSREVALCRLLADTSLGAHAHDLSEGGLAVALAELCLGAGCGADVRLPRGAEPLWGLFGESTGRALVTCAPDDAGRVLEAARAAGVGAEAIGELRGGTLRVEGVLDVPVDDLREAFEGAVPSLMDA